MFDFYAWSRKLILGLALCLIHGGIAPAQDFFGWKPQWLHRNDVDYVEPIRTYADGYNVAKAEQRPLMILVSTKPCQPCRVAKRLIEDMRADHSLGDCVLVEMQLDDPTVKAFTKRHSAPQLLILDFVNPGENGNVGIEPVLNITRQNITAAIANLPAKLEQPIALEQFVETVEPPKAMGDQALGATEITWDLATEYKTGAYNGTFTFGSIQYALDGLGRYVNLRFRRVTRGGQLHFLQSSRNGPGAAWTNGATIRISPTNRFVNEIQCGMVTVHEFLHVGNGTSHHAQDGGIMGPNGGYLLLASDFPWMQKRGWKSALRPTDEPDWFKKYLSRNAVLAGDGGNMFPLLNGAPSEK